MLVITHLYRQATLRWLLIEASQVWNMAFSFYHSLITTPRELRKAAAVLRLSPWKKFWKLKVPFAMPGLIWNTMMSVSQVVLCGRL